MTGHLLTRSFRSGIFKFVMLMAVFAIHATAQEMPVPADVQGELIPKILLLDKNKIEGNVINLGILYNKFSRISYETFSVIKEKVNNPNEGIEIKIFPIEIADLNNLKNIITGSKLNSLFITPLRGVNHKEISEICAAKNILTFSADPGLVHDFYSVGFDLIDNKVKITINLKTVQDEGAILSSRLLKIARIVEK